MSGPRDAAKRLGELLQRQRLRARFSLEDASRRVGISVEMLSAIEGALAPMNWKVVDDLLNVYYSRHLAPTVAVLMREATSQSAGSGGPIAAERRGPSAPQKLRGILVSYRRSDEREFAGRIVRYLRDRLGPEQIFIDSDSIEYGSDFPQELDTALTRCAVLLVVIGPRWVSAMDGSGNQRLHDPHDWVRLEVERGLLMPGIRVVPVLVDGTSMPTGSELPESLWDLRRRNAFRATTENLAADVDRLVSWLNKVLDVSAEPPPVVELHARHVESRRLHIVCSSNVERSYLHQVRDALRSGGFHWPIFEWVGSYLVRDTATNTPTLGDAQFRTTDWILAIIDASWETSAAGPALGQLWKAASMGCIVSPLLVDSITMPTLRFEDKSIRHLGGTSIFSLGVDVPYERLAARLKDQVSNYDAANS